MKKLINSIGLSFLSALFLFNCGKEEPQQAQQQQQAKALPVIAVPQREVTTFKSYPTTIEGIVNSDVRAKVSGYVQKVLVDEGESVKKGQPLFELETQSLSQDADAAKASVNAAQVEVNKIVPLVEKGIISEVQLETQKANLAQAKSNYNSILANIGYAHVKSPVNGVVGSIPYREGSLISATSERPLTTVADISQVYAYFSMNETEYLDFLENTEGKNLDEKIKNFPEVELLLANGKAYSLKGKIQTVTGQIDSNTGTVSFRAMFDNPNRLLTNGNSGTIRIPSVYEKSLVIPQSASFEQQGQILVYKLDENNKAVSQVITIKDKNSYLYLINSGLKEGDKIVAKGANSLRNNTPVQPQVVPFDSIAKPIQPLFK